MELLLELMSAGSYQVECSDEGLMTEDIEKCLAVVIKGIEREPSWLEHLRAEKQKNSLIHHQFPRSVPLGLLQSLYLHAVHRNLAQLEPKKVADH